MRRRIVLMVALVCFVAQGVFAQTGGWKAYLLNARFGESSWRFQFDAQHRDHNLVGDMDHIIIRPGLQYFHEKSQSSYLLGYSFFLFQPAGDASNSTIEHRPFQDIDLRQNLGRLELRHRYRFEQRFIENTPFIFRMRYSLFVNIPLNNKTIVANTFYIPLFNEVFVNAGESVLHRGFDRNWLYGGLGYRISENLGVQLGYMMQHRISLWGGWDMDPKVWLSLHHNLHFNFDRAE